MRHVVTISFLVTIVSAVLVTACDDKKPAAPTSWKLTVAFACDPEDGCGEPPFITFAKVYASKSECDADGAKWLEPNANPTGALASFSCGG